MLFDPFRLSWLLERFCELSTCNNIILYVALRNPSERFVTRANTPVHGTLCVCKEHCAILLYSTNTDDSSSQQLVQACCADVCIIQDSTRPCIISLHRTMRSILLLIGSADIISAGLETTVEPSRVYNASRDLNLKYRPQRKCFVVSRFFWNPITFQESSRSGT